MDVHEYQRRELSLHAFFCHFGLTSRASYLAGGVFTVPRSHRNLRDSTVIMFWFYILNLSTYETREDSVILAPRTLD